ncbi:hypothetical protein BDR22DRAFT_75416 [Usnea florida]
MMSSLYIGWTALQGATATDHHYVVRDPLTREKNSETNLEAKNENTEIPLLLAVNNNHYNMAILLLKQELTSTQLRKTVGLRFIRDAYGQTALYCAVAVGADHTVDQLSANRPDIMIETLMGATPWYRAHREGKREIIKLMKMNYSGQETHACDSHVRLFSHAELRAQEASLNPIIGQLSSTNLETLLGVLELEVEGSTHRDVSPTMRRLTDEKVLQY